MKKIAGIFFTMMLVQITFAQDQISTFIQEAQNYLAQKDYRAAQLSLQDVVNEINNLIAGQIAEALPAEINGLTADESNSNTAGMGMLGGGMTISKTYRNASKESNEADVTLIANAPMLSMLNMYIQNPTMMGQEYKSVRVGTRRAILKSEMQEYYPPNGSSQQIRSSEIQIPLTQTLITIQARGFASEQEELAFAAKLDVEKIRALLGE